VLSMRISREILIVISIIILFAVLSFILRALPALQMDISTYHMHGDPDTWYNFRQIEVMVSHFPQYNWFDPMTAFPSGKHVAWGPVFPFSAAALSVLLGVTQRFDIMLVSSWVTTIFALSMIPVMFFLGRLVGDWKTGIISVIFIAVVSGNYFYESYFGVVDHHIAEVLFTTIFSLFYITALQRSRLTEISLIRPQSLKILFLPSFLAGIAFGIGMLTSPTCILFLVIVGLYTILQYSWNMYNNKTTDYLFVVNCIISTIPLLFLALNGIPSPTYSLADYSIAQFHVFFIFIIGTIIIQILSMLFKEKPLFFIFSILGIIFLGTIALFLANVPFISSTLSAIGTIFAPGEEWATVSEFKPWSFGEIWASFNIGIILALIGIVLVIIHFSKEEKPAELYIPVWAILILFLNSLQIRWEYYSAVIISLLSAYTLSYVLTLDSKSQVKKDTKRPSKSGKLKEEKASRVAASWRDAMKRRKGTVVVLICLAVFCGVSVLYDYAIVRNTGNNLLVPAQWVGALEWAQTGTPSLNISYYGPYDPDAWEYPPDSYGILSWWDNGHWITFIAKRIPVTNPFQDNIAASATFFLTESEDTANKIVDSYGVRYIITDSQMVFGKFPGLIQWYNKSFQSGYYTDTYYLNDQLRPDNSGLIGLVNQHYYSTMVVRLQNLDGSLVEPDQVAFAIVSDSDYNGVYPIVSSIEFLNHSEGLEKMNAFETHPHGGTSAVLKGFKLDSPVEKIDALQHYRLVYEDAASKPAEGYDSGSMVKVFEYVPGARLSGEGVIEVKILTNLGRTFTYRQEAENGFFILPYSTEADSYPVRTVGPYRLVSSGRTIEVSENDVRFGETIS
jgi:oligosaccharyl transferase (archaeosortase A-associated)